MKTQYQILTIAWLAAMLPGPSGAGETGAEFGFDASAGYQYDSNVNVAEIDTSTGESDSAILLSAGVNGSLPITSKLAFNFAYDYSQTSYRQFADFDVAIHHAQAALAYGIAGLDTGVSLDRYSARLGRERFLDITQVSPSVARLFGESLYLRAAYTRAEKGYAEAVNHDAVNDAVRADAYFLFDGMHRYLSLGYDANREDALDAELDYKGSRSMLAYGHRIELGSLAVDLKTRLQFENRDFANVTETIDERRRDQRMRAGFSALATLSEYFALTGEVDYARNRSNLATADFDETVYTISLALDF